MRGEIIELQFVSLEKLSESGSRFRTALPGDPTSWFGANLELIRLIGDTVGHTRLYKARDGEEVFVEPSRPSRGDGGDVVGEGAPTVLAAPCPFGRCSNHSDYRYGWPKSLAGSGERLLFVMKNPSCPDSIENQTFRNMVTYATKLNASSLDVVNLFARRTGSSPKELNDLAYEVAVGPENDAHIRAAAAVADRIIVAWGNSSRVKWYRRRVAEVGRLLADRDLWCVQLPRGTVNPLHPQVWSPNYVLARWTPP